MIRGTLRDRLTFGSARRRRQMHRRLRELDRWYAAQAAGQTTRQSTGRAPARRETGRRLLVALSTALVSVPAALVVLHQQGVVVDLHGIGHRIGAGPAVAATGTGPFTYLTHQPHQPSDPVTYDPYRPIHVVTNERLAPAGSDEILDSALARVSAATGLRFVRDGSTTEQPTALRPARSLVRYGAGWSPVLVAWTTPQQDPRLAGRIAGVGGSVPMPGRLTGRLRYVTGAVSLDAPGMARTLGADPAHGRALARAIVMHELGHVVGLGHVDDPQELMDAENVGRTSFGPGDLRGLSRLGQGPCSG